MGARQHIKSPWHIDIEGQISTKEVLGLAEEKKQFRIPHNIILEDRKSMSVSGISDVDSFDEENILVYTDLGELSIRGENLHINQLNIENGELTLEGNIISLAYSSEQPQSGGFFGRLFK